MTEITMKDLLEAGVHFGHQTRRWNPKMKRFIFMERNRIYIIDLHKTLKCIQDAKAAIEKAVRSGGHILFVATKKQAKLALVEESTRCNQFYITERWLGGMLTNFKTIRTSIKRLHELDRMATDGTFEKLSKKEVSRLTRERERLQFVFGGIKEMPGPPSLVFVIDTKKEEIAVTEAARLAIPIVGIVDTNCDPTPVTFPIPGNDDAIRSIRLFTAMVATTVLESKAYALEGGDEVTVSYGGEETEAEAQATHTGSA